MALLHSWLTATHVRSEPRHHEANATRHSTVTPQTPPQTIIMLLKPPKIWVALPVYSLFPFGQFRLWSDDIITGKGAERIPQEGNKGQPIQSQDSLLGPASCYALCFPPSLEVA